MDRLRLVIREEVSSVVEEKLEAKLETKLEEKLGQLEERLDGKLQPISMLLTETYQQVGKLTELAHSTRNELAELRDKEAKLADMFGRHELDLVHLKNRQ